MMMRYIVLLLFTTLAGCAISPAEYQKRLSSAKGCCESLEGLYPNLVILNNGYSYHIGDKDVAETIELDGTKTFAKKVALPEFTGSYLIKIATNSGLKAFFVPKIIMLDENHKVTRTFNGSDFRFNRTGYKGTIFINDDNSKERFLVIMSDSPPEELPSMTMVNVQTASLQNGASISWATGDNTQVFEHSVGGQVNITFESYQPIVYK